MSKKISNIIFFILLAFLIFKQGPLILENFKLESSTVTPVTVMNLVTEEELNYPDSSKSILIMWATWCAPCKIEMRRIQNSIKEGKIKSTDVFAMNLFEDDNVSKQFIKKSNFDFTFISKNDKLINTLGTKATPTTYLFSKENQIHKASTGISIVGIYQLENFLKN